MRRAVLLLALLLAAPAYAQIRLPTPPVADEAPPSAFVAAARTAIAAGRAGEAMEAIERAESRVLVRSVRPSRAATPSEQDLVRLLAEARAALARGDRAGALDRLSDVMTSTALDAPVE